MISDVCDIESLLFIQGNAVGAFQLCLDSWSIIARETSLSCSSDGPNLTSFFIDATNNMVLHLDKVHVAGSIKANFIRFVEIGS